MASAAKVMEQDPSTAGLISEKRIGRRITFRPTCPLREKIEREAHQAGMTISDYLVHLAAMQMEMQAEDGRTWSDRKHQLLQALDLAERESDAMTPAQKVWILIRLTHVQQMILAGRQRCASSR